MSQFQWNHAKTKKKKKKSLGQVITHLIGLSVMWRSRIQPAWIWPQVMDIRKMVCSTFLKAFIFGKAIFELFNQNLANPCVAFNYIKGYFKTLGRKKKRTQISVMLEESLIIFLLKCISFTILYYLFQNFWYHADNTENTLRS